MTIVVAIVAVVLVGVAIGLATGGHTFLALLAGCAAAATVAGYFALRS
jgi:hypothetical protein